MRHGTLAYMVPECRQSDVYFEKYFRLSLFSIFLTLLLMGISIFDIGYPIISFMVSPIGSLDDFRNPLIYAPKLFNDNIGVGFTPIQVVIYEFLNNFSFKQSYIFSTILSLVVLAIAIKKFAKKYRFIYIVLFSYPILFCLSRGNNDIWLIGPLLIYYSNLIEKKYKISAVILSLVTSVDPLFSIYSIFLMQRRKIKYWIIYAVFSLAFYAFPVLIYGKNPIIEILSIFKQYLDYNSGMIVGNGGLLFGNSFVGFIKSILLITNITSTSISIIANIQNIVLIILFPILVFLFPKLNNENKSMKYIYMMITSIMVLYFSASPDYKLIFFIPSLLQIILDGQKEDMKFFILIQFLFIPKHFIWFTYELNPTGFTLNSLINPAILIILVIICSITISKNIKKYD